MIRQAQANIAARRAGLRTPLGATPAAAGTPGFTSMLRTPAGFARTPMATPTLTPRGADGDPLDRCVITGGCCEGAVSANQARGHPQAPVLPVLFFLMRSGSPLVLVLYLGQVFQPCCVHALYTTPSPCCRRVGEDLAAQLSGLCPIRLQCLLVIGKQVCQVPRHVSSGREVSAGAADSMRSTVQACRGGLHQKGGYCKLQVASGRCFLV